MEVVNVTETTSSLRPRCRSLSVGQPLGSMAPLQQLGGRLQARLEASFVGLEELALLRQMQRRAIEAAKILLLANIPEFQSENQSKTKSVEKENEHGMPEAESSCERGRGNQEKEPCTSTSVKEEKECLTVKTDIKKVAVCNQPVDRVLGGRNEEIDVANSAIQPRQRAHSLDVSVAGVMSIRAKTCSKKQPVLKTAQKGRHANEAQPCIGKRTRSSSFSLESRKQDQNTRCVVKNEKLNSSTNRSERKVPRYKNDRGDEAVGKVNRDGNFSLTLDSSLSGSFLSLGSSKSYSEPSRHKRSNSDSERTDLKEADFDNHFKSPRSLTGSKLTFEFPSPMHAILLHYDKTDEPVLHRTDSDIHCKGSLGVHMRRASFSGPVGRRTSRQEVVYKMRKDSSLSDLPSNGLQSTAMERIANGKVISCKRVLDDGVSTFIEMLASRGLAKKRQEERERMKAKQGAAENSLREDIAQDTPGSAGSECSGYSAKKDTSNDMSSLNNSQDIDSGQWEGASNLSSSGKLGSHVSIRSSSSSKASLSSEEGYYSNPSSPQNKHSANRLSILSSTSFTSAGSLSLPRSECSDEDTSRSVDTTMPDSPASSETITPPSESLEIVTLPNSPGAKRRLSTSAWHGGDASEKTTKRRTLQRTPTIREQATRASTKPVSGPHRVNSETKEPAVSISKKSPVNMRSDLESEAVSPAASFTKRFEGHHEVGNPSDSPHPIDGPGLKKDASNLGKILPDVPRMSLWKQNSQKGDSPPCLHGHTENPKTPTILEEPRKEADEIIPTKISPPVLCSLQIPDTDIVSSPPICQAPKIPSWRRQNRNSPKETTGNVNGNHQKARPSSCLAEKKKQKPHEEQACISDRKEAKCVSHFSGLKNRMGHNSVMGANQTQCPVKANSLSITKSIDSGTACNKSSIEKEVTEKAAPQVKARSSQDNKENEKRQSPSRVRCHDSSPRGILQPTPRRQYLSKMPSAAGDSANIFQYPSSAVITIASVPGNASTVSQRTPTLKEIPEILKNWVESRTPTNSSVGSPSSDEASKSSTLPKAFRTGGQPLTPTFSLPGTQNDSLVKSKRLFRSQELVDPKGVNRVPARLKLRAVESTKQDKLNQALKGRARSEKMGCASGTIATTEVKSDTKSSKNVGDKDVSMKEATHMKGDKAPPTLTFPTGDVRPRAQSWSRGTGPLPTRNNRDAWVREVIVPPSTPTCKAEAKIYEGRVANAMPSASSPQARLQWYRTCADIKDTFV